MNGTNIFTIIRTKTIKDGVKNNTRCIFRGCFLFIKYEVYFTQNPKNSGVAKNNTKLRI